ncbi:hypothetical protein [Desulfonatronovibrio magnus]|uniref:hypothetical protein n=1 Tax=Desulfonatronovibrio magnus TaxID=698827 RepID=UPI0005EB9928|nr:hypothetical protein [Desulfonatronovibrio magnus]
MTINSTKYNNSDGIIELRKLRTKYFRLRDFAKSCRYAIELYSCFKKKSCILDLQDRFDIVISAAYAGNVNFLKHLKNDFNFNSQLPGFQDYINGFIGYSHKSKDWMCSFYTCAQTYMKYFYDNIQMTPEYVEHSSNFFPPESYNFLLDSVKFTDSKPDKKPTNQNVILISCDIKLFLIFSDFFSRQLRLNNKNLIYFIVIINDSATIPHIISFSETLKKNYKNIEVDFSTTHYNMALMSSLYRFLKCEEIMVKYNCNCILMDIDMNVDFDISQYTNNIKNNLAFTRIDNAIVPWVRFNAGLSYFRNSRESINFLRIYSAYINYALNNGGKWTLDQAGLLVTKEYYQEKFGFLKVDDSGFMMSYKMSSRIPDNLKKLKGRAKLENLKRLNLRNFSF